MDKNEYKGVDIEFLSKSSLHFEVPTLEGVAVAIEYTAMDKAQRVSCEIWAELMRYKVRGRLLQYSVPYMEDKKELEANIVIELNIHPEFPTKMQAYIQYMERILPPMPYPIDIS